MQSAGNSNSVLVKLALRLNICFVFGFAQVKDAESRSPAKVQEALKGGAVAVSQLQDLQSEKDLITAKANDHLQRLEPLAGQLQVLYNQVTEVERFRAYISWINKVESVRSVDRRFEGRCKIGRKFSPKLQSGDHVSVKSARRNVFFMGTHEWCTLCVVFSGEIERLLDSGLLGSAVEQFSVLKEVVHLLSESSCDNLMKFTADMQEHWYKVLINRLSRWEGNTRVKLLWIWFSCMRMNHTVIRARNWEKYLVTFPVWRWCLSNVNFVIAMEVLLARATMLVKVWALVIIASLVEGTVHIFFYAGHIVIPMASVWFVFTVNLMTSLKLCSGLSRLCPLLLHSPRVLMSTSKWNGCSYYCSSCNGNSILQCTTQRHPCSECLWEIVTKSCWCNWGQQTWEGR